ncbi:PREDICTED: uncharacterized protein LOC104773407 [Camelina sativa]|uniref:Uncharacterized protein LOC104773407 n=1 Tax=Camelina sativa TaxID=90675 RepID=A0ABM0Y6I5_CAMSA|nr:PREDICTED: uncharacterized protein LOC104773407 [Camelina sativa]
MEMRRWWWWDMMIVAAAVVLVSGCLADDVDEWGQRAPYRIHTLFSVECQNYFDWQTVGLMHSFHKSRQPGPITRLLSCTDDQKKVYRGMNLAPTFEVPSWSTHPKTHDWYPAINKPVGVLYWLQHSEDAQHVDWVVILDADMIIRGPIIPWELGAELGRPFAAHYGYLVGCDNILVRLHTKHPELCDKVGGLLAMHIEDLRVLAPLWLSKTEDVRQDTAHWTTNITGDVYGKGWISEMYGYSFGAAEAGLKHKINDDLMIYPGYVPREGVEPVLLHYGLPFSIGNWSFTKLDHHEDNIVYDCNRLFPEPPYPREVKMMEPDPLRNMKDNKTINPPPVDEFKGAYPKIHTLFSTECTTYFDWQTVGFMHSFRQSGQPGNVTRLLSCTDEDLKNYKGHDLAPTHYVPSMSRHPLTGDWYPAINKPAAVVHWLHHTNIDAEYIVILDADMILRGPITPWEFKAARGRPVSTPYDYLIGCDNDLARLHTRNPEACDKVGGVIMMHIEDLRKFAMYWLLKTQEVRADKEHYGKELTGDIYESGWISEMYGYSFGAAELNLRHIINKDILIYPGYIPEPGADYRVFHYGLEFKVGNWSFDKANWRNTDLINKCWAKFPDPPSLSAVHETDNDLRQRDLLSIECGQKLNEALFLHHKRRNCPEPGSESTEKISVSRKVGKVETKQSQGSDDTKESETTGSSESEGRFSTLKLWVIALWLISGVGFLVVMLLVFSTRKVRGTTRGKGYRNKRRTSYSNTGFLDTK